MTVKLTKQGEMILELIQSSDGHMTADQIHTSLKNNGISMGIATIYRNLNVLYANHQINRVRHPDLGYIYDKNLHRHYHFRCQECDRIVDVEIPYQSHLHQLVEDELECFVTEHEVTFEGICKDCLAKRSKKNSKS